MCNFPRNIFILNHPKTSITFRISECLPHYISVFLGAMKLVVSIMEIQYLFYSLMLEINFKM